MQVAEQLTKTLIEEVDLAVHVAKTIQQYVFSVTIVQCIWVNAVSTTLFTSGLLDKQFGLGCRV